MQFIEKFLDALKLEKHLDKAGDAQEINNNTNNNPSMSDSYNNYYENQRKEKENNLKITYKDVEQYNFKPFDLKKPFITDGNFIMIALDGYNLDRAYQHLEQINKLLLPFKHLYEKAAFPSKIDVGYAFHNPRNSPPVSNLRLTPYTATKSESKYPLHLFLSYFGYYGSEYCYIIYFNQNGEIGKADLSLSGSKGARLSYQTQVRENENGLYVRRITKTIYVEPYGTTELFLNKSGKPIDDKNSKTYVPKSKDMTEYEIEQYAKACNAYVVREERKERNGY